MKKTATILCCLPSLLLISCGRERKTSCPVPVPLVDSAGAASEKARVELQWSAVRDAGNGQVPDENRLSRRRLAEIDMERSVLRYRDSMRIRAGTLASPGGCVDWRASVADGALDRQALATALVRTLVDSAATVMEWSLLDSASDSARMRAVYSVAGKDGGAIDSASLEVGRGEVRRIR
jgi:hypothetical protein